MSELNNCFKEAVCIEVQRIFDSCSDRDCIYELPVTLSADSPGITDDMDIVRTRCAEVEATCISVDAVPFKSGYYSVDITYRFKITAEAFLRGFCRPQTGTILCGTALWNKRVILYGGEAAAKVFTSEQDLGITPPEPCDQNCVCCGSCDAGLPKATVRVVDPIALDTKFKCVPAGMGSQPVCPPDFKPCPCTCEDGTVTYDRILTVSLGLFSIVQLSRPVSLLIPAYDYCIPCKDCTIGDSAESPCEVFDRIEFPSEQFFPQSSSDSTSYDCCKPILGTTAPDNQDSGSDCGCNQ